MPDVKSRRPYARAHSRGALPLNDDEATAEDIAARVAERDARDAMDSRTPAQVWLGDPPGWRSALAGWPQEHLTSATRY